MPDSLAAQRWARIHEATHCTTDVELTLALNLDPIQLELAKAYGVLPLPWLTRLLCTHGINPAWIMTGAGDPYITETFQPLRHAALLTEDGQDHRRQEMAVRYLLEYPPFFQSDPQFNKATGRALAATGIANLGDLAAYLGVPPEEAKEARRNQRLPLHWLFRLMDRGLSPDWICEGRGPRSLAQATA